MTQKEKPYIVNGERVSLEEYRKTKYEDLRVRVPKGKKADLQAHAEQRGESLNGFVNRAIDNQIAQDKTISVSMEYFPDNRKEGTPNDESRPRENAN